MDTIPFLRLLQLFDSQFPIGAYAYSHGLETYGQIGIGNLALRGLLAAQIELGWGRLDLAAMALAYQHTDELERLSYLEYEVSAWKVVPAVRESSLRLGKRTLALARRLFPIESTDILLREPHQAIVLGLLARRLSLPLEPALAAFAQSTLGAALLAATRCMPLSPGEAQEILVDLQPAIAAAVGRVLLDPEESLFAATPGLDIRAHQQAFLHTRLFQS